MYGKLAAFRGQFVQLEQLVGAETYRLTGKLLSLDHDALEIQKHTEDGEPEETWVLRLDTITSFTADVRAVREMALEASLRDNQGDLA